MTERIIKEADNSSFKFPAVDVVEASAGSGKTYALAKRYVQLILNPTLKTGDIPLKSILAVTFTNKATLEMKQRILEFLKRIAFDRFDNKLQRKEILSSLAVNPSTAKKLAYEAMDEIIGNYNFFQVQTIDSFINTILKGCAFYLNLSFGFRIKQDQHKYLVHSIDSLIDKIPGNKEISGAFNEFLDYYLFAENKESWFSKRNIVGVVEMLYDYKNTYGGSFRKSEVEVKEIIEKKKIIIRLIEEIYLSAPKETDKRFIGSITKFLDKNKDSFSLENISAYFARKEFPVKKGVEAGKEIAELWTEVRNNLDELCKCESLATFNSYIKIFNLAIVEFRELADLDDVVFLSELNLRAQQLFEDGMTVPEIYYRIATRLHHYLIDEFQDTSELQWKNIFPMLEDALSSGGSLFCVGDKKQAIFRFRGGDISLFDSIDDNFAEIELKPGRAVLKKNFRSQKEIVEFNNEIFAEDNLEQFVRDEVNAQDKNNFGFSDEDVNKVLNIFKESKEKPKEEHKNGYVKVEAIETATAGERDAIIKKKIIFLIEELKQRFGYGDIAILTRENKDVELFTSWLIEKGIPVNSERTVNIRKHALVKELISFLKFLNSPIDNLSFASFILGDIFRKASGIEEDVIQDFLFNHHKLRASSVRTCSSRACSTSAKQALPLQQPKAKQALPLQSSPYLYREFRNRFSDVWNNRIDEFFKNVGFAPLYELMINIFNKFKVIENFPGKQGFFMRLLELIKEKEEDYSGLSSFLELFEEIEERELFVNIAESDSVRIMTIHKAKGLEFPVVIIPFLEMDVGVGAGASAARKPYILRQSKNNDLRLVRLKKKYGVFSEELGREYKNEYLKSLIDELNTLYVALTRPMYELYLFIPSKVSGKDNLASNFIPYKTLERGSKIKYEKEETNQEEMPSTLLPVSKYSGWMEILKGEFISPPELINRDNLLKGNIIHFLLSYIGNLATEDKEESLRIAGEKAKSVFLQEKNLGKYIAIVRNLLEDKKFRQFFYVKAGSVFQEKDIADSRGNRKIIDRLIITSKEVWIVDYKSSRDGFIAQKEQMSGYMEILKSIYPKLKIKGFLIYPDSLTMKEVEWNE